MRVGSVNEVRNYYTQQLNTKFTYANVQLLKALATPERHVEAGAIEYETAACKVTISAESARLFRLSQGTDE